MNAPRAAPDSSQERPTVKLAVLDEVTPSVLEGLTLYAREIGLKASRAAVAAQWLRWHVDNPYGRGLFVVATHGAEVVGFLSLIPVLTSVSGEEQVAGKGEFLVVDPRFIRARDERSGAALGYALFSTALQHASAHGMRFVFAVPSRAAQFTIQRAGGVPLAIPVVQHVAFPNSKPPRRKIGQHGLVGSLVMARVGHAALRVARLGSASARKRLHGRYAVSYDLAPTPLSPPGASRLVAENAGMLRFRFHASQYTTISVHATDTRAPVAQLVLSRPDASDVCMLYHWSPHFLSRDLWTLALDALWTVCAANQASHGMLVLPLPDSMGTARALAELGFVTRERLEHKVFLAAPDPAWVQALVRSSAWDVSNSHTGFDMLLP